MNNRLILRINEYQSTNIDATENYRSLIEWNKERKREARNADCDHAEESALKLPLGRSFVNRATSSALKNTLHCAVCLTCTPLELRR